MNLKIIFTASTVPQTLFYLLCCTLTVAVTAMDKPIELSTPTKVRMEIYRALHDILEDEKNPCDIARVDSSVWEQSPQSFSKSLRKMFEKPLEDELQKKGISPELVRSLLPEATRLAHEECQQVNALPVKSPLKRQILEVAHAMKVPAPEIKTARLDNPGLCRGDTIYVDENHLHHEAPTPRRKKAILAHELRHYANRDYPTSCAISMACDMMGATVSPRSEIKRVKLMETFADLEASAVSAEIAEASKRLTAEAHARYGDAHSETHPSEKQRRDLSQLADHMHQAEHKRLSARRNLQTKFKDAWEGRE